MKGSDRFHPSSLSAALLGLMVGSLVTLLVTLVFKQSPGPAAAGESKAAEPLYWVAPMDPNYRRDQAGKSPMGMDLIPVYKEDAASDDAGPGAIRIAPNVVQNLGVRTAKVERKQLREDILAVGYVKFDENKLIHIHPRVSGWVDQLHIKTSGDPVSRGQALYSLYSPELVNAQEELILALNRNNGRLIKAAEERLQALQIPAAFIRQLKASKTVSQTVTFYSPQQGVVDELNIREGFYVQPGTTLLSIGALDSVWVEAEVFERQASLVKRGARAVMHLDYLPGSRWQGEVDYIYPTLDETTRTLRLRLQFDNPQRQLLPNMFAQVAIAFASANQVLLIPREALIRTGEQNRVVLALGEGRFKSIAVTPGRENLHYVEIVDGLREGDEIVASAHFLLDSESSKTSDFMRLDAAEDVPAAVWVAGVIDAQLTEENAVTVSHEAIEEWNMMGMTMNFAVAETVNFAELTPGTTLHLQIEKGDSAMYTIVGTQIIRPGSGAAAPSDTAPTHGAPVAADTPASPPTEKE